MNIFCLIFFLVFSANAFASFDKNEWKHFKDIKVAKNIYEYNEFKIDADVYDKANPDLSDVRIIAESCQETSYAVLISQERIEGVQIFPKMLNNSHNEKYTTFILDMGKKGVENNRVIIDTKNINYRRAVEIYGSDDLSKGNWKIIRNDGCIFNVSNKSYFFSRNTVDYPVSVYRYLKVIIKQGGEKEPLIVENASVSREVITKGEKTDYIFKVIKKEDNKNKKAIEILIDLEKNNIPLDRISITSLMKNYNRQVVVDAGENMGNWNNIASGFIYNYRLAGVSEVNNIIEFPEIKTRYLRLSVYYYDDKPLEIDRINVYGNTRKVVYEFKKNKTHRLFYGNNEAKSPRYDTVYLSRLTSSQKNNKAELGLESQNNPDYKKEFRVKDKYILWLVIVLISGGLLYLVINMYRKFN